MKKLFIMLIAVAALTFVGCTNKANQVPEAADTTEALLEQAKAAAEDVISNLTSSIEAGDASAIEGVLNTVKEKVAELLGVNPEVAQSYLGQVQGFLKDNVDKVKAVVGDNAAVSGLLDNLVSIPTESVESLTSATEALGNLGIDPATIAKDAASEAVENAQEAVENVKEAATEAVENAKDAATEAVENAKDAAANKANEAVENAKDKAGQAVDDAAAAAKKKLGL